MSNPGAVVLAIFMTGFALGMSAGLFAPQGSPYPSCPVRLSGLR